MRHLINGCAINLRGLTDDELANIVISTLDRQERVAEELESLRGEQIRRSDNVHQLRLTFDVA